MCGARPCHGPVYGNSVVGREGLVTRTLLSVQRCSQEMPKRLDVGDESSMSDMSLYAAPLLDVCIMPSITFCTRGVDGAFSIDL